MLFFNPKNEYDMKTKERKNMKKLLLLIRVITFALVMAALNTSCVKFDEKLYSQVTPDNFFKTEEELVSALGAEYTLFAPYATSNLFDKQEATTDEVVVPTRGQDWDDGGTSRRLHLHSWKYEDNGMGGSWDNCYAGVNTANRLIYQFQLLLKSGNITSDVSSAYVSELQTLRGFFYWQLVDLYGNIPLVTDFTSLDATPKTVARKDVYDFIVTDLEAAVPLLSKTVGGTNYARMNYYAGQTLLAKLYLNAEVYSGAPQWNKVITACDEVLNSGKYSLESNYFANFNENNSGSKEFIFSIPYDQVFFTGFNLSMQTLHYGSQATYNLTSSPWNGYCSMEEFYNSYTDNDLRKGDVGTLLGPATKRGNFIAGYQYILGGGLVTDGGADADDPDGPPLNFGNMLHSPAVPQINELGPQGWRQSGVRIGKWEFANGGTPDLSNDYAVFRYADVLLMKAEALFRLGNTALALPLVNQIRERAGLTDLTSLDGKVCFDLAGPVVSGGELLNEMGREMAFEHNRRQDLIRWGFWNSNDKWAIPYHNVGDVIKTTGDYLKIFPIPKAKLDANPNLVQNPGY